MENLSRLSNGTILVIEAISTPDGLIERYLKYIPALVYRYRNFVEVDELISVGTLALVEAVHDLPKDCDYIGAYLVSKIKNAIRYFVRCEAIRMKRESRIGDMSCESYARFHDEHKLHDLMEVLDKVIESDFERDVVRYRLEGYTFDEVAFLCTCSQTKVINVCNEIRSRFSDSFFNGMSDSGTHG